MNMKLYKLLLIIALAIMFVSCAGNQEVTTTEQAQTEEKAGEVDLVPAYEPEGEGEMKPIDLPPITEKVLENGLKLIAIEHHELPVVSINLMIESGAALDPEGLAGTASFTADMLTKGTETRTATDIASEIDFIGGNLRSWADWHQIGRAHV